MTNKRPHLIYEMRSFENYLIIRSLQRKYQKRVPLLPLFDYQPLLVLKFLIRLSSRRIFNVSRTINFSVSSFLRKHSKKKNRQNYNKDKYAG
jgi:hypothetical protein